MNLKDLLSKAQQAISVALSLDALEAVRVDYLGKEGAITQLAKGLGKLSAEERPKIGKEINELKDQVQVLLSEKLSVLKAQALAESLAGESLDVSLPGRQRELGSLHPVTLVKAQVQEIFASLGFETADGPEIETDFYNFEALNIPAHHPARAMHDTFYIEDGHLLRTHMSPVQIRTMEKEAPPIKMIAMGRVYRHDFDLTHTPMFHQLEGLVISEDASFAQLKGLLQYFLEAFFEKSVRLRLRPSYFPFTEPSAEVDMSCVHCEAKGCRVCSHTGWLEILGCGMVHPQVLAQSKMNTQKLRGYAFGVGLDRLAMLKYKINDLRMFFENDLRFLREFRVGV